MLTSLSFDACEMFFISSFRKSLFGSREAFNKLNKTGGKVASQPSFYKSWSLLEEKGLAEVQVCSISGEMLNVTPTSSLCDPQDITWAGHHGLEITSFWSLLVCRFVQVWGLERHLFSTDCPNLWRLHVILWLGTFLNVIPPLSGFGFIFIC